MINSQDIDYSDSFFPFDVINIIFDFSELKEQFHLSLTSRSNYQLINKFISNGEWDYSKIEKYCDPLKGTVPKGFENIKILKNINSLSLLLKMEDPQKISVKMFPSCPYGLDRNFMFRRILRIVNYSENKNDRWEKFLDPVFFCSSFYLKKIDLSNSFSKECNASAIKDTISYDLPYGKYFKIIIPSHLSCIKPISYKIFQKFAKSINYIRDCAHCNCSIIQYPNGEIKTNIDIGGSYFLLNDKCEKYFCEIRDAKISRKKEIEFILKSLKSSAEASIIKAICEIFGITYEMAKIPDIMVKITPEQWEKYSDENYNSWDIISSLSNFYWTPGHKIRVIF